jgi:DNA-binding transcriptional ArsR family regulator
MSRSREGRPGVERARLDDLAQVRVLAHPLRLRVLQALAEHPATAKQVAEQLGEPPTRLYHHVHVLERAGLIRLREVRPNRGTTERYFEAVARKFEFGRHVLERAHRASGRRPTATRSAASISPAGDDSRSRAHDVRAIAGVVRAAMSVMNLGLGDLRALKRHPVRIEPGIEPFVARTLVAGTRAQIRALRSDLMRLLERHARRSGSARTTEARYTLTLAFVPEARPRRRGRR